MSEEERQAAVQQQEEAFAAYIKPRLEEMRRVVSAYSIEQERLKDFYQTIKKRQREVNRMRDDIGQKIERLSSVLGAEIALFEWDHDLMHDGDIERIYADFARRIQVTVPGGLEPLRLKLEADFDLPLSKREIREIVYRAACHNVKGKRQEWKARKPPAMP